MSNPDKLKVILMDEQPKKLIAIDFAKLAVVPITDVRLNTWNPKDKDTKQYADVKKSIQENGLMGFIAVRENPTDTSKYEIIDGEQRFSSCLELGFSEMVIYNEGVISDKRARELTIWWQAQVPFNELSLAKLVTKSIEEYGDFHTYFSEKQLEDMKKLASFNWDQYKASDTPPPPVGELLKNFMVQVSGDQYTIIASALDKAKKSNDEELNDGGAIELICQSFLDAVN